MCVPSLRRPAGIDEVACDLEYEVTAELMH
jgi:hypothetical protein